MVEERWSIGRRPLYASVDGMYDMVTGSVHWSAIGSQQELEKAHHMRQRVVAFMREHDDQICSHSSTGCSHEEIAMGAGAVDAFINVVYKRRL